jgi:hypothetical protein
MSDKCDWVVWNGSLGVLDMAALGRIEHGESGRSAWLAAPYDMVGPFSLDELQRQGRIAFGACLVLSRERWKLDQTELRLHAREQRRALLRRLERGAEDDDHRAVLELSSEDELTTAEINAAFRRRAKTAHPDAGGDHETYIRLTEARDALLARAAPAF